MRICLVNYRYFVSSGPERYLFGVKELLEARGHEAAGEGLAVKADHVARGVVIWQQASPLA